MRAYGAIAEGVKVPRDSTRFGLAEPRWSLAFLGVLGYPLVIKNMSLLMLDVMMFKTIKTAFPPRGRR